MRAVIQRVSQASVEVEGKPNGQIGKGVMILLGIEYEDTEEDIQWLAAKIAKLRIFEDEQGVNNLSLLDVDGDAMIISQFTLHASTKKGNRPSYLKAARPDVSVPLYNKFIGQFEEEIGKKVATGEFGAHMDIHLTNDGPVTILIDTKNKE